MRVCTASGAAAAVGAIGGAVPVVVPRAPLAVAAELRRGRRVAPRIVVLCRRKGDSDGWRAIEKTRAHLVGQQRCQRWALFGRVRLRWW